MQKLLSLLTCPNQCLVELGVQVLLMRCLACDAAPAVLIFVLNLFGPITPCMDPLVALLRLILLRCLWACLVGGSDNSHN